MYSEQKSKKVVKFWEFGANRSALGGRSEPLS